MISTWWIGQALSWTGFGILLFATVGLRGPSLKQSTRFRKLALSTFASSLFVAGACLIIGLSVSPVLVACFIVWTLSGMGFYENRARRIKGTPRDVEVGKRAGEQLSVRSRRAHYLFQLFGSGLAFGLVGAGIGSVVGFYASASGIASWLWPLGSGIATFAVTCRYFARRFGPKQ